jgi:hypothetical protein
MTGVESEPDLPRLVQRGLMLIGERLARSPDWGLYRSVQAQLEFIRGKLVRGERPSDAEKDRIILGLLAVREFENVDDELADVLHAVNYGFNRL